MFLLFAAAVISAPAAVSAKRVETFQNTNQLLWDATFQRELARFISAAGKRRSGHAPALDRLHPSIIELLGGPPDPRVRTPKGSLLFTACRQHSCDEKGGVVVAANGRIVAVAAIGLSPPTSGHGRADPQLRIWVDDASKVAPDAVASLTRWGLSSARPGRGRAPTVTHFRSSLR